MQASVPISPAAPTGHDDALLVADAARRVAWLNHAAERLTGWSTHEARGRPLAEVFRAVGSPPDFLMRGIDALPDADPARHEIDGQTELQPLTGPPRLVRYRAAAFPNLDGGTPGLVVQFRPATAVDAESRSDSPPVRDDVDWFRRIADATPVLIWMSDSEKRGIYFNQTWLTFTGRSADEQLGDRWLELVHPDDREPLAARCLEGFRTRTMFTAEFRLRRADGEYRWMLDTGAPCLDSGGEFLGFVGSCVEIHDRKCDEDSLRESEQRFARFMQHLPGLAWIKDSQGRYLFANEAAAEAFRVPSAELYGRTDDDVFPPQTAAQYRENDRRALASRSGIQVVETLEYADGVVHESIVSKFPIIAPDGVSLLVGGMAIDVTERRRAESLVQEQRGILELIARGEPAERCLEEVCLAAGRIDPRIRTCIVLTDAAGAQFSVVITPRIPELAAGIRGAAIGDGDFGTCAQAVVGRAPVECADVEHDPRWHPDWKRLCLSLGIRAACSIPIRDPGQPPQGSVFLCFDVARPMADRDRHLGEVAANLVGIVLHRERSDRALRAKEAELELVADMTPLALARCGRDLRYRFVNRAFAAWCGRPAANLPGALIADVMGSEHWALFRPLVDRVLGGESVECELQLPFPARGTLWVRVNCLPERGSSGDVEGWLASIVDIDQHKRAQEVLHASEARFRSMANINPAILWTAAPNGRLTWAGDRVYDYTGLPRTAAYEDWWQIVHPDDVDRHRRAWEQALSDLSDLDVEVRLRRHDGEYRWFLIRAAAVPSIDGGPPEWYGSTTDIHDRKLAEQTLRDADRRKNEFLAVLAHELRNPLAPVRAGLELLTLEAGDHGETIALMREQVRHLVRLVDDLLDVSRLTHGRIELRRECVDVAQVVQQTAAAVRGANLPDLPQLTVELPPQPVWLNADPVRLAQVLQNLLQNAVKCTDATGRIEVHVQQVQNSVEIRVSDTGIGVEPELLPHIFELFTQSERAASRLQGGLGIGLSLVRQLVESHGGSVSAHSDGPGRGSTFVVRLPGVTAPEPATFAHGNAGGRRPLRVLLIDDNAASNRLLSQLLTRLGGHAVETAGDGEAGLAAIRRFRPDVVFLDLALPGKSGLEVARTVRECAELRGTHLVAVTGFGQAHDRIRCREAGFDQHLTKPVEVEALQHLLAAVRPLDSFSTSTRS